MQNTKMSAETFDKYVNHLRGKKYGDNLIGLSINGEQPTEEEFMTMARALYLFAWGKNPDPKHPDDFTN